MVVFLKNVRIMSLSGAMSGFRTGIVEVLETFDISDESRIIEVNLIGSEKTASSVFSSPVFAEWNHGLSLCKKAELMENMKKNDCRHGEQGDGVR
jgi:hypothetical protein